MTEKILFLDAAHNIVAEKNALWKVIHKYDKAGKLLEEAWIDLRRRS